MKFLFWSLWALAVVPVTLYYLNPFVGTMGNGSTTLHEVLLSMSIIPFCIVAAWTLVLEIIWRWMKHREVKVWRLPVVSGLGVAAAFWAKIIVMAVNLELFHAGAPVSSAFLLP